MPLFILLYCRFLSSDKKKSSGAKREAEVLVQRKKDSGSVLYRVLDNPTKLSQPEWSGLVDMGWIVWMLTARLSGIVLLPCSFKVLLGNSKGGLG